MSFRLLTIIAVCLAVSPNVVAAPPSASGLSISWENNILTIKGKQIPGGEVNVWYLEAYCRADAHEADWSKHTVIGHTTEFVSKSDVGQTIKLRCTLKDGVIVDHVITAKIDEVDFQLTANNPTKVDSEAVWAQPCMRVGDFTGLGDPENPQSYDYLRKSFVFQDGRLETMPTPGWATKAGYTPGQVWRAPHVPGKDVNPRPLNPNVPTSGLIGCYSQDEKLILATAWEPWHELFQGVITCLHSDFHIGGLKAGESKTIRGKIYIVLNDVDALVERYERDLKAKQ